MDQSGTAYNSIALMCLIPCTSVVFVRVLPPWLGWSNMFVILLLFWILAVVPPIRWSFFHFVSVLAVAQAADVGLLVEQVAQSGQLGGVPAHGLGHRCVPEAADFALAIAELRHFHVLGARPAVGQGLRDVASLTSGMRMLSTSAML